MYLYRADAAHQGTSSVAVSLYLCHDDKKKLARLQEALGVSDKLSNARSITVSKLIRLAYAQHFPPRKPSCRKSFASPKGQTETEGPAPKAQTE